MISRLLYRLILPMAALVVLSGSPRVNASTIFWESNVDELLFDASENALDGGFTFEVGIFDAGFVPTADNLSEWAGNWRAFGVATDANGGWVPDAQFYAMTIDHNPDGTSSAAPDPAYSFTQGEVVYVWVYNTKNRETDTEWALVADGGAGDDVGANWFIPDPTEPIGDVSYVWTLSDADLAIYGNVNGTFGGGQPFTLQTSLVPVPEPGPIILLGVTMLGVLLRRRRVCRANSPLAH